MKLIEARIDGFGKFRDARFSFKDGLNLIEGPNESGKSTLHAFIEGMFFGLVERRGRRKSYVDLHTDYEPREAERYGGVLIFESDHTRYRVERTFKKQARDPIRLYDDTTGEDLTNTLERDPILKMPDLSKVVGFSYPLYRNTLSIRQLEAKTDKEASEDLSRRLQSLGATRSETFSTARAKEHLNARRREEVGTSRTTTKPLNKAESKREALKKEYQQAKAHHEALLEESGALEDLEEKLEELRKKEQALKDKLEREEAARSRERLRRIERHASEARRACEAVQTHPVDIWDLHTMIESADAYRSLLEEASEGANKISRLTYERHHLEENKPEVKRTMSDAKFEKLQADVRTLDELKAKLPADITDIKERTTFLWRFLQAISILFVLTLPMPILYIPLIAVPIVFLLVIGTVGVFYRDASSRYEDARRRILRTEEELHKLFSRYDCEDEDAFRAYYREAERMHENHGKKVEIESRIHTIDKQLESLQETFRPLLNRFALPFSEDGLKAANHVHEAILRIEDALEGDSLEALRQAAEAASDADGEAAAQTKKDLEAVQQKRSEIERDLASRRSVLEERKRMHRPLSTIAYELSSTEATLEGLRRKDATLKRAVEYLERATKAIEETFSPTLEASVAEYLKVLTGGVYEEIRITRELGFTAEDPARDRFESARYFSRGTLDQIYLAIRLGTLKALGREEAPLILDDAFVNFDDARLDSALSMFERIAEERQVLLFTCQRREGERLRARDIPHHTLKLEGRRP